MKSPKNRAAILFSVMLLSVSSLSAVAQPKGYPRSYSEIVDAARNEGELIIYSTTDESEIGQLLAMFKDQYPFIRLDYREMASSDLYQRVITEEKTGALPCDLVWSSAMDLQTKLVNDKYAQSYASPEKPFLPPWAIWKNEAYGITAEPVVIVYNEDLVPEDEIPRSHRDLIRLLNTDSGRYRGKIATFDPEQSGLGYLTLTQDSLASPELWALVKALGKNDVKLYHFSRDMLESVASGEHLIGYNAIGSYAYNLSHQYPQLKIVMPDDYTLVLSRIAVILSESRHPNAARLFLDFLLSLDGQNELANHFMSPVREDIAPETELIPPRETLRPVHIGPTLLIYLDQIKREHFLKRWRGAIDAGRAEQP